MVATADSVCFSLSALCGMIFLIHGSSFYPNFFSPLVGDLLVRIVFAGWWKMETGITCLAGLAADECAVCGVGGERGGRHRGGGGSGGGCGGTGDAGLESALFIVS
jgi:hypothetical protein